MSAYATDFGPEPFTFAEARRVRLTRDRLTRLVRSGEVRRVLRGVYVDATASDTVELRARAAAKLAPGAQVVCCRTAAWLWGADVLPIGAHRSLPPLDVMTCAGGAAPRRNGLAGRTQTYDDADVVLLHGVRVTTPARTAADLGRLLRRPDALASYDALRREVGLSVEDVADVLDRMAGYRGVVQARDLLVLSDPGAESPMESRTRLRWFDAGFGVPETQIEVSDEGGFFVARLDLGRREAMRAVEFDGDEAHASAEQQVHDRRRRSSVERCGWGIAVVTTAHVLGRGLAFERALAELLGEAPRLSRHHPRYGGWDRSVPGGL